MSSAKAEVIDLESNPEYFIDEDEQALQRAILASLRTPDPPQSNSNIIDLTHDDDHTASSFFTPPPSTSSHKKPRLQTDQSSSSSSSTSPRNPPPNQSQSEEPFVCQICFDPKPLTESFRVKGCTHVYCKECMSSYVAAKLQDSVTHITCPSPSCHGILEPYYCRDILPLNVFERWGTVLCEALIAGTERFYCPFKDCSALLINDGGAGITESECPHCNRLFCAQCKSSWHFGMECAEYQKLDKGERDREDILLMNLAKDKKWKRCPKCKIFVEKVVGCMYMKCRCNFAFCYNCGAAYNTVDHMCPKCKH